MSRLLAYTQYRYLVLRRISQISVFLLFALPPLLGWHLFYGNLSSSLLLETVPLTDPLVALQTLIAGAVHGQLPSINLLLGGVLIFLFYGLLGGRSFCAWVCPVNLITDLAAFLRQKLRLPRTPQLPKHFAYAMLALVCVLPLFTTVLAWEWLNPVPVLYRVLMFSSLSGLWTLAVIFLVDLLLCERAWCGHLCPTGALYSLAGKISPLKVISQDQASCDKCMKCFDVCPERQILTPALKVKGTPVKILDPRCTLCGRCMDVCDQKIFHYAFRPKTNQCVSQSNHKTKDEIS